VKAEKEYSGVGKVISIARLLSGDEVKSEERCEGKRSARLKVEGHHQASILSSFGLRQSGCYFSDQAFLVSCRVRVDGTK
jgi:hypothetical protein